MATHDYVIDNSTGANVRSDLNNVLQAILTNNSSSSAPSTTAAYMWWADTTTGILKIRNSANDGWVELLHLDGTLTLEDGSASTPALAFRDDLNTGIFSSAADTFNVATGGVERMELGATTIFNEDGADVDFRIEGDSQANLFYVDAGNNRIGLNTSSPEANLHMANDANGEGILLKSTGSTSNALTFDANRGTEGVIGVLYGRWNGTTIAQISFTSGSDGTNKDDGFITFGTESAASSGNVNATERMRLDSSGRLLLGTTSLGAHEGGNNFTIAESGHCGMTIRSSTSTSGNIYFADGTSSAESARGEISYRHATDDLRIFTAATERFRVDSSGRILVGTGTQFGDGTDRLMLENTTNGGRIAFGTSATFAECIIGQVNAYWADNKKIAAISFFGGNDTTNKDDGTIRFSTSSANNIAERMRILSDGAVVINATARPVVGTEFFGVQGGSASNAVGIGAAVSHKDGIPFFASNSSGTSSQNLMRFAAGSGGDTRGTIVFNGSAMVYGGTSDYRLKENIKKISDGISKLKNLNPINFNWIKDEKNTNIMGFLAHEVQQIMPEAVSGTKDGVNSEGKEDYQEMDYGRITPLIVAALKELITRVEMLEAA